MTQHKRDRRTKAQGCQTAIKAAHKHVEEGFEWVVDVDLEKFFDQVCHQRLKARLLLRVADHALHKLIGKMLKAKVVMPDGVVVSTEQGVSQGGPLSPLLSNLVPDELDQDLEGRGHRFVRYADDLNDIKDSGRHTLHNPALSAWFNGGCSSPSALEPRESR